METKMTKDKSAEDEEQEENDISMQEEVAKPRMMYNISLLFGPY